MNVNNWFGVGRVANKPILKPYTNKAGENGMRCFFRVAITRLEDRGLKRSEKPRAVFIPVVTWGAAAERHAQYLDVGTEVTVMGQLIIEPNKLADGTFGPDFVSINARDIQYGRRSEKNASLETLHARKATLDALIASISAKASGSSTPEPSDTPTDAPASTGENPFEDGDATPASAE